LVESNPTSMVYPSDTRVHKLFEEQSKRAPNKIALVLEGHCLTYGELNARANQLAHHLRVLGIGPDTGVGICLERSLDMVTGILGILKAGGAWLPLDPAYPKDRQSFMLKHARVPLLLTQRHLVAELPEHEAKVVLLDAHWPLISRQSKADLDSNTAPTNLAYLIYTSGSTGQPKGVMIPHANLVQYVHAIVEPLGVTGNDIYLHTATIAFSSSVRQLMVPLSHGARVVIATAEQIQDPMALFSLIRREKVSIIDIVPSYLRNCIHALARLEVGARTSLLDNHLRLILTASEPLLADLPRKWMSELENPAALINMFGQTETTGIVTTYPIPPSDAEHEKIVPIGRPVTSTRIYILDTEDRPVPIGATGEICIGGATLARGYLHQPELTAEKFVPDSFSTEAGARLYRTGDLGRYLPDGNIEFVGRMDQQVKIRGFRVELSEIESVLNHHEAVEQAVVIAREDAPGDKRLVAYVVRKPEETPTISNLRDFASTKLPDYMVPANFVFLDALPLTPTGKVNRAALPAPDHERPTMSTAYLAPRTEIERILCQIWTGLLNVEKVGIDDDFFELGGDSILAIQMIGKADQAGIRLTPQLLLKHTTVQTLTSVAGMVPVARAEQGLVTGPLPLTPIMHWFLEQRPTSPNYYNQAVMLEVRQGVDPSLLCKVVEHLLIHHDVLRLRCMRTESGWRQFIDNPRETGFFSRLDFTAVSEMQQARTRDTGFLGHSDFDPTDALEADTIEGAATKLQASLNLSEGPLIRVGFFDRGPNHTGRLLICIHHFAVDGVSWRIFLEDLQTGYEQMTLGTPLKFPSKTTSFKEWAHLLSDYAQSGALQQELSFWLAQPRTRVSGLPVNYPEAREANTVASGRTLTRSLEVDETRILLQEVPKVYHTQINDVLLTALVQAFVPWTGACSLLLDLEGHGREKIKGQMDLSRTMGWFTSIFPVLLDLDGVSSPGEALQSIKEQLQTIPNRGIGYGVLRYLSRNAEVSEQLQELPQAELRFNYLGQFDQALAGSSFFKLTREPTGPVRSQAGRRRYLLDVSGSVVGGQLHIDWTFSENVHRRGTIEDLAERYVEELRSFIAHCQSSSGGSYVPSDLPSTKFSVPASFAQQRLWFLDQLEPSNAAYNMSSAVRISGPLDVAALQHSLSEIVRRHEVLRTSFAGVDGRPVQVVARHQPLTLSLVDLRNLPETEREDEARRLLNLEAHQPFDLARGSLIRTSLLRLDEEDHVLVYVMHHIVFDGWSKGIFLKELSVLYDAFSAGKPSPLAELTIQYADFAVWQRELQGREIESQLSYWKEQLNGASSLALSTDWPRPAVQTFRGARYSLQLPKAESNQLRALSQQNKATLFMTLLAAFKVLLHRRTGQDDIVVGSPNAGRNHRGVEGLIGFFVNTLVLRTNLSGNPTFRELLQRVREVCLAAFAHQDLPFEKLVEELRPERTLSRHPLFQVAFVLENAPAEDLKLGRLAITPIEIPIETAVFDFSLEACESGEGLHCLFKYNRDLFEASTISQVAADFETLLHNIIAQPEARLETLVQALAAREQQQRWTKEKERKSESLQKLKVTKRRPISPQANTMDPKD
jgi:amino acid adenylation domain-containing protein/non-ribosomal peptide synthase protein (TIGR01720 family)